MQNRVNPFGEIITTKARGSWMGNRGRLHNERREITHSYKLKAWLTCRLEFRGRKRKVMAPNRYTELFFLDEAIAFAAGHRPCFECRREDADLFKRLWLAGNPEYKFTPETSIRELDKILHKERRSSDGRKKTYEENINDLPDGAFVVFENQAWLIFDGKLYLWSPFGYEKKQMLPPVDKITVLTPRSIVNTFRAGYVPHCSELRL